MAFCRNCGAALQEENKAFCGNCGAPTGDLVPKSNEETEFLDVTARLLRWERKAWCISGNVLVIVGAVFAALFLLLGFVFLGIDEDLEIFAAIYFIYAMIFGGVFVTMGIVDKVLVKKVDGYLAGFQQNPTATLKRCDSVGMIVFCAFFNSIALVFYIINFARMKANKSVVASILGK